MRQSGLTYHYHLCSHLLVYIICLMVELFTLNSQRPDSYVQLHSKQYELVVTVSGFSEAVYLPGR